jgi:hypothetical protein
MSCSPDKIIAALHEQTEIITDIVREEIADTPSIALRLVADGGTVRRSANNSSVIYGEAKQAPVAYNSADHAARDLVAGGQFKGRTLHGTNGIFNNLQNDIDDNACHGQFTIDFSQGFRIREFEDYELSVDTPVKCARDLDRLGEAHIRGYFRGMKNQFSRWGMQNFSDNLLNLIIRHGEANASVLGADTFNVTAGGWEAPPAYRISIFFLQEYRDHIVAEMKGKGFRVSEDYMLTVEMPRQDWIDAVIKDKEQRDITGTQYVNEQFKDTEGPLKGRSYGVYGGIKCYFNEEPIRGYFKRVGTSSYNFVRVYPYLNTMGENGGIISGPNHDYRRDTIIVDGVSYDMVTLIPHVDPRSFKRYGLVKPIKPVGGDNAGVNYEVRVIDGPSLGCNDYNDKFKLAARHEFRFKAMYPEFSGFIAYRSSQRSGYVLEVSSRARSLSAATATANPEAFRTTGVDDCMAQECAQCGQTSENDGTCIDPDDATADTLGLQPSGAVTAVFEGSAYTLRLAVTREGTGGQAVSVSYATADVAGGDSSDAITSTSGTLTWEAGDMEPKFIEIPVLSTADDNDDFTVTLSSPSGATLRAGANVATVTINDIR